MGQSFPAGDGDQSSIRGNDSVANGMMQSDIGGGELGKRNGKIRLARVKRERQEEPTLMCCHTSDSGLMTLISG